MRYYPPYHGMISMAKITLSPTDVAKAIAEVIAEKNKHLQVQTTLNGQSEAILQKLEADIAALTAKAKKDLTVVSAKHEKSIALVAALDEKLAQLVNLKLVDEKV